MKFISGRENRPTMDFSLKMRTIPLALLTLLHLVAFIMPAHAMSSKKTNIPCVNPARIKMGSKIFYIPRPWNVDVTHVEPYGKLRELCNASEPVEVKEWHAFIPIYFLVKESDGSTQARRLPRQKRLQIGAIDETGKAFKSLNSSVLQLMRLQKVKKENLPVEGEFRVWRYEQGQRLKPEDFKDTVSRNSRLYAENVYFADDADLVSPQGEPAIFACIPARTKNPQTQKMDNFEYCRISIWDGEIDLTVTSIDTRRIPKEKWKELYLGLLKLRQSLLANTALKDFESPQ